MLSNLPKTIERQRLHPPGRLLGIDEMEERISALERGLGFARNRSSCLQGRRVSLDRLRAAFLANTTPPPVVLRRRVLVLT